MKVKKQFKITEARQQVVRELHKPARIKFKRRRFIQRGLDDTFATDLAQLDQYSRENKANKYILVVIDCFSKFLWTAALKSKSATDVSNAMEVIFKKSGRIPKNLLSDHGKEYYGTQFQNLMKKYNINHYSTFSPLKASIAERVIRTIKGKLFKFFTLHGNHKWLDLLPIITETYNNTKHSTTRMKPIDVNIKNERTLLNTVYSHLKVAETPKYKIGDIVRISKYKHVFQKGYIPNWSTELFKIIKINITYPRTYLLEDMNGHPISGGFYEQELQKTKQSDVYLIEQVLRKKGDKLYVKWLGFDKSHNSWIDQTKDIT